MEFENKIDPEDGSEVISELEAEEESVVTEDINGTPEEVAETEPVNEKTRVEIVGIKFKKNGKTYHFSPNGTSFKPNDRVIVDTSRGQEYGLVSLTNREISSSEIVAPLRSVLRLATDDEIKQHEENVKKEIEAYNTCIELIDRHGLEDMKLIDTEMSFDRSKLLFYFSSEVRVDFRELVKDLASTFHTRIEMRQIGIRDEAKILGGLGICGRPFCCSSFLQDFVQVSVKMAKEQNLSLNAAKISGSCGRLMCCLRYEYDTYLMEKSLTPKVDTRVMTPDGPGVITDANPLAGIVKVRLDSAPDNNSQVIFVREDVVKESEYNGEKLVKTDVPDRSHKNDIDEFIPVRTIEAADVHALAPEAPKADKPTDVSENPEKPEKNERQERGGGRRDERRFDKHRNGQSRSENAEQADAEKSRGVKKPLQDQKPQPKDAPQNAESGAPDQARAKKKHKPYYKNFKKKHNGGDKKPQQ